MKRLIELLALSAVVFAAGCAAEKSENPLSPTIAGPIPGVEISAPKTIEPGRGQLIAVDRQPLTLLLENAASNGPRPLTYAFEVATDAGFSNKVFTRDAIAPGDGGRTALRLPDALGTGLSYYWRAKAEDGANTGPYSSAANFNVFTPVVIDVPGLIAPINNVSVPDLTPEFRLRNAPRSGPAGPITYTLELADNDAFASKFAVWQFDEHPEETKFAAVASLLPGRPYFWHVRASDSNAVGPWSATQVFRTPVPAIGAPPPPPGNSCRSSTTELNVVECRRSQFGSHMSDSQLVTFLQRVAGDLNAAGFGRGPFGLLRKTSGANCNGYSCDIICAGSGTGQRQWDVLGDSDGAQTPAWNGPHVYPNIRTDSCLVP
ncbi:MAG: hypothetical protein GEU82_15135 [Luteitalea sp.]|nr:hypothetical protein [Luteitalea sp.]